MSGFIAVESYRQAIRNNRLLRWVIVALAFICLMQSITLISLFPLKTIEKELYEFSSSGQTFYRIASSDELTARQPALVRMAARQYVNYRETVDRLTEEQRFESVLVMSNDDVVTEAQKSYAAVNNALGEGKRKIIIELDNFLNNNPIYRIHHVEFQTIDIDRNGKETINYWQAVIGYQFNEQKIRLDDLVQNPLGFEVISYAITRRNSINQQ